MIAYATTATVNRMSYTGDKSAYASVGTVEGYFEPIDPTQQLNTVDSIQGQAYMFRCGGAEDIKSADRLTIGSDTYSVAGVRRYTVGILDHLECSLELGTKV